MAPGTAQEVPHTGPRGVKRLLRGPPISLAHQPERTILFDVGGAGGPLAQAELAPDHPAPFIHPDRPSSWEVIQLSVNAQLEDGWSRDSQFPLSRVGREWAVLEFEPLPAQEAPDEFGMIPRCSLRGRERPEWRDWFVPLRYQPDRF